MKRFLAAGWSALKSLAASVKMLVFALMAMAIVVGGSFTLMAGPASAQTRHMVHNCIGASWNPFCAIEHILNGNPPSSPPPNPCNGVPAGDGGC